MAHIPTQPLTQTDVDDGFMLAEHAINALRIITSDEVKDEVKDETCEILSRIAARPRTQLLSYMNVADSSRWAFPRTTLRRMCVEWDDWQNAHYNEFYRKNEGKAGRAALKDIATCISLALALHRGEEAAAARKDRSGVTLLR